MDYACKITLEREMSVCKLFVLNFGCIEGTDENLGNSLEPEAGNESCENNYDNVHREDIKNY